MDSRPHQLGDLPDVAKIVHGPLVEHLVQGDFTCLRVPRAALTGASRQGPQKGHVGLALLREVTEGFFRVGITVQLHEHPRLIRLEFREVFVQEPIHARPIAVALGMGKMREHFRYGKAVGRRLPWGIFGRKAPHQSTQNRGGGFQLVEAVQFRFLVTQGA